MGRSGLSIVFYGLVFTTLHIVATDTHATDSPAPGESYGDLTDKEHCIKNLSLAFRDRDIVKIAELLHDDFVFVTGGGEWRAEEYLRITNGVSEVCLISGLIIRQGEWERVKNVQGADCAECWQSRRGYVHVVALPEQDSQVIIIRGYINVVVVPLTENGLIRWKILEVTDLEEGLVQESVSAPN
jgi:hypothetical protein